MTSLSKSGIRVFIPSYKRHESCITQRLFLEDDYTFVVRESERKKYEPLGNIVSFPDKEIDSLPKVRQKIIDECDTDYCLQVDDDIEYFAYKNKNNYWKLDREQLYDEILRNFQILEDLELGMWSLTPLMDVRKYHAEYLFKGVAGGVVGFNKKYFIGKYDPELFTRVDMDVELQELLVNRIIIIPDYLGMKQLRDTNKGGNNVKKNTRRLYEVNEYMKLKWGKYYSYNPKNNVSSIKVKR